MKFFRILIAYLSELLSVLLVLPESGKTEQFMTIHVVKEGEKLKAISDRYQIPVERLILENGITNPDNLVVGQTIVIVNPLVTYTVQEGDTLIGVANKNNVTVLQLLRNNPYLSDREVLYPGETIVITYDTNKTRDIIISGYTYPFIGKDILKKTLPFLTYLTVFNYRVMEGGNLIDIDDKEIIDMAKAYGVAPMMLISTISELGTGSGEVANDVYVNLEYQDNLINNVINMLNTKGYYGLNIYLQYLKPENKTLVESYIKRFSQRLRAEGFRIIITVTPHIDFEATSVSVEKIDYSTIAQYADGLLFLSYDWAYSYGPPASATPINIIEDILKYVKTIVPPEKTFLGLPIIGYDWQLPYVPGATRANAITYDVAIELAVLANVAIQYDKTSAAPYFYYTNEIQELHIVWFKDARSIDAIVGLVPKYNLAGNSIWNIMRYFAQMWFIINTEYDIERIEDIQRPLPEPI